MNNRWAGATRTDLVMLFAYVVATAILLAILGGILIALVRPQSDVPNTMFAAAAHGVGIVIGALLGYRAGDRGATGVLGTNAGKVTVTATPPIDLPGTTE